MIYALDKIAPGTANDDTLLYGVEVKFYNMEVSVDENLETSHKGLYHHRRRQRHHALPLPRLRQRRLRRKIPRKRNITKSLPAKGGFFPPRAPLKGEALGCTFPS